MKASWRTTTTGILTIVVAVASGVLTWLKTGVFPDLTPIVTAVTAGIGLLSARDDKVSSEQAGAK